MEVPSEEVIGGPAFLLGRGIFAKRICNQKNDKSMSERIEIAQNCYCQRKKEETLFTESEILI